MGSRASRVILGAALGLAACGSGELDDVVVRPFSEVQASEFIFEADPTNPGLGIFRVTTTEPMICAIVWGEGEGLGNFNNSLDMAGTGIVRHDVFLPGAEPGVEYTFVVQGTTADGTIYRSEVSTFTIPVLESTAPAVERGPNLAEGAEVIAVSSEFSSGFDADNAVDGDLATEWSTAGDGDLASITIDLGEPTEVGAVEFLTRSMTDGSAITDTFTVTVDGGTALGPFPAGNPAEPKTTEISVTGQVFAFAVSASSGGNTGAVELGLYGP
ncbi:MAG: discoidin domain-containing protein [Acidimicrobiia bacterium]